MYFTQDSMVPEFAFSMALGGAFDSVWSLSCAFFYRGKARREKAKRSL
jgi:hypothetical protein